MSSQQRSSLSFLWYLVFIAAFTAWIGILQLSHPNGWTPGDWLINYKGGFVRRGLSGELILVAGRVLHVSPLLGAMLLPLLFYGVTYYTAGQLFALSGRELWEWAALLSPATLAFPVLDPTGAYRKEVIFLASLGLLLLYLQRRQEHGVLLSLGLTLGCVFALLCHEAILPYLLYFAGALLIGLRKPARVLRVAVLPVLAIAAVIYATVHHHGDAAVQAAVCQSLGPVPPIVCSGAIAYLARGSEFAHSEVAQHIRADHYFFYYPLLTLLAALPLAYGCVCLARRRTLRFDVAVLLGTTAAAALGSVPLFVYALDWGRWISIHAFSVFFLLLFIDARARAAEGPVPIAQQGPALRSRWVTAGLMIYATCWNLPHYGNYPKKGYLNVPLHLLKQRLDQRAHGSAPESPLG